MAFERHLDRLFQQSEFRRRFDLSEESDVAFYILQFVDRLRTLLRFLQPRIEFGGRKHGRKTCRFFRLRSGAEFGSGPALVGRPAFWKKKDLLVRVRRSVEQKDGSWLIESGQIVKVSLL